MNRKGFTLIEVIIVLIILGVLAAIAMPNFFTWIERARSAEALFSLQNIKNKVAAACIQTVDPLNVDVFRLDNCLDSVVNNSASPHFSQARWGYKTTPPALVAIILYIERNNFELSQDPWLGGTSSPDCNTFDIAMSNSGLASCYAFDIGGNYAHSILSWGIYQGMY